MKKKTYRCKKCKKLRSYGDFEIYGFIDGKPLLSVCLYCMPKEHIKAMGYNSAEALKILNGS